MAEYLIVGGGISGILAARILASFGKTFTGIEKEDGFGGRCETGHHRLLAEDSVEYIRRWCPIEWYRIDEDAKERRKGDWARPDLSGPEREKFYLEPTFFHPKGPFSAVITNLGEAVKDSFHFRKTVEKIDSVTKTISCQDGTDYTYSKLLWCTHLSLFRKLWSGSDIQVLKGNKRTAPTHSGINIDFGMSAALFPFKNSIVFPFRFKDQKLRAIGISDRSEAKLDGVLDTTGEMGLHWLLFLEEDLTEDREELAKVIRTLKRELQKEFPEFQSSVKREKITFLPALSGDEPSNVSSLSIAPSVFYLGPQVKFKDEPPERSRLINIDRALMNCRNFEEAIRNDSLA